MKLPRVRCTTCERPICAGPVAGSLSKGRLCRHDAPGARRDAEGSLISCRGSLEIVDLPMPDQQLEFDVDEPKPEANEIAPALFMI